MGPEASPAWARRILNRKGLLLRGTVVLGEASCLEVRGCSVYLTPLTPLRSPPSAGAEWSFRITDAAGMLQLTGVVASVRTLTLNQVAHRTLELLLNSSDVKEMNRRNHYRVPVAIKGEIAVLDFDKLGGASAAARLHHPQSKPHLDKLAKAVAKARRPCVIHDLSVSGARLMLASPPPPRGQTALLDLALGLEDTLRNLCCQVTYSRAGCAEPPFDAEVRLRFLAMAPRTEAQLSRYLVRVQRDRIQQGIRS